MPFLYRHAVKNTRKNIPMSLLCLLNFLADVQIGGRRCLKRKRQDSIKWQKKIKKRYESEMANYKPPKGGDAKNARKRKRTKDPNAPKRSLSAFFWFSNDERPKVKESMPDSTVGDITKELGRRWNEISPEVRSKYEALAAKDKARYMKEVKAYKGKKPKAAPSKASKKKNDSDEESGEEEEEEEEPEEAEAEEEEEEEDDDEDE
ncbi:High mobility group protein DSP1, partial [Stegodyphus mimosarum]